jgi:predicted nicotinamide N-methyase
VSPDDLDPDAFVLEQTTPSTPPLVPELRLHLATEATPLWRATQELLDDLDLPPPYWAFAWPGGQALARYLLDHPSEVAGKRVLAFAAGGGVDALAAAKAGAASVTANEIDPFAAAALDLNAAANGLRLTILERDIIGQCDGGWEVVIAGDVFYERPMADRAKAWFSDLVAGGAVVLLADPGRAYRPAGGITALADYDVSTSLELEDAPSRRTTVYRWTR